MVDTEELLDELVEIDELDEEVETEEEEEEVDLVVDEEVEVVVFPANRISGNGECTLTAIRIAIIYTILSQFLKRIFFIFTYWTITFTFH